MNTQEQRLTEEQSDFAQNHHHVVMDYLRRRRLPENEFYDVVIFRYLKTVQLYCTNPQLRKYKFEPIAFKAMDLAVKNYWHNAYQTLNKVVSLDARLSGSGLNRHEVIPADEAAVDDVACDTLTANELLAALSETQHTLLSLRLDGYSNKEIAGQTGMSRGQVERTFACMRTVVAAMV